MQIGLGPTSYFRWSEGNVYVKSEWIMKVVSLTPVYFLQSAVLETKG